MFPVLDIIVTFLPLWNYFGWYLVALGIIAFTFALMWALFRR